VLDHLQRGPEPPSQALPYALVGRRSEVDVRFAHQAGAVLRLAISMRSASLRAITQPNLY